MQDVNPIINDMKTILRNILFMEVTFLYYELIAAAFL